MTENIIKENLISKNPGVPIASSVQKQLITIRGTLTSSIQSRGEENQEPYYYAFIKLKGQNVDLPVIFKIKEDDKLIKPTLKKSDQVELTGYYSNSDKSVRKSFTALSYQVLNEKRIKKKCVGCCDIFTCYQSQNYNYCKNCKLNGNRYLNKDSPCPECDGSGIIKFPNQPPRSCKLCYLARQEKGEDNYFTK
jgi:hypothetical protein